MRHKPVRTPQVHTPPASATKECTPPATINERAMHTRDPQSGGVQANVAGRHIVDHQDAGWRGGSVGPHAHGNAVRRVVDGPSAEGSRQQKPRHDPPHPLTQPQYVNYWAPLTRKRHQQEHRPQRLTERSDPTQHAKGRTGDCPGPCKETATRRRVTRLGRERGRGCAVGVRRDGGGLRC